MKKKCTACGKRKEVTKNFYRHKGLKGGYYGQCKPCHKERVKAWAERNYGRYMDYQRAWAKNNRKRVADAARRYRYRKKYGMTEAEVVELFETQEGRCRICRDKPKRPHVDHCHKTNKVRGILCGQCNIGLGMFKDDVKRLRAAIAYLSA